MRFKMAKTTLNLHPLKIETSLHNARKAVINQTHKQLYQYIQRGRLYLENLNFCFLLTLVIRYVAIRIIVIVSQPLQF